MIENNKGCFDKSCFENGRIRFTVMGTPVSLQGSGRKKKAFKNTIQRVTSESDYIISDMCWVTIEYLSENIKRFKNPNAYDIDNIVKPILDGLTGIDGIILDDILIESVSINWIDTPHEDHFTVEINHPFLVYREKANLVLVKSQSGWCLPFYGQPERCHIGVLECYFEIWNKLSSEEDYNKYRGVLPIQNFIYHTKIRDKGYEVIELGKLKH